MATGVLGLGSGQASALNSDLIDKLKTAERASTVAPIEKKIENIATEKETFSNIQTKISELLSSIKPFDLFITGGMNAFDQKTAATTGDSVTFDAADVASLQQGFTTVDVTKVAQKDVFQSNSVSSTTKDATFSSIGDLYISVNGAEGVKFTTTGKTYTQLAEEINTTAGIAASVEQVGTDSYRLIIKSEDTGLSNKLSIYGNGSSALGLDDAFKSNAVTESVKNANINQGNLVINGQTFDTTGKTYSQLVSDINATSGMTASVEQVGTDSYKLVIKGKDFTSVNDKLTISGTASTALGLSSVNDNHIVKAQNLEATVDGVGYNVSSNTLTVNGLKITAVKAGSSSINISEDNTQLETQMNSFITKYNELVAAVEVELQSSDSKLGDKSSIRNVLSVIKGKLFTSYGSSGDKSIFGVGIEIDKYGSLSLNSTKFNETLKNDMDGLKDLFVGTAEKKGLGTILKETLDEMTYTGGVLSTYDKGITTRETALNTEKTAAEKLLDSKYELMSAQFAAYGTIINQMESSFSGLKMMIQQSITGN